MVKNFSQSGAGFTLIELLVAMTLFVIFIALASQVFLSGVLGQRNILGFEQIFEQSSYSMEYMNRSLRMAKKETDALACLSTNGRDFELTHSGQGIKFINSRSECQEFYLDASSKRLKENKAGQLQDLTGAGAEVVDFNIYIIGEGQTDGLQPRATIFLKIASKAQGGATSLSLSLQTTVSQRKLDIQ